MQQFDKTPTEPLMPPKPEKQKETIGEMLRSLVVAILIALLFRSVAYEPFHIPSSSMYSTLYTGDYIFVSKPSYGYSRYSFPFGIEWFEGRKLFTEPKRGDVVVFRNPDNPRIDYIKRVIGLPGDVVQMRHGRLFINGALVEQVRRGRIMDETGTIKLAVYEETLPNGVKHTILNKSDFERGDHTEAHTVPPGHYFLMGDNRDNSEDSRFAFAPGFLMPSDVLGVGFVPADHLIGRADLILLSYDTSYPIWKFWKWPEAFRHDRWFKAID
jgi:signal peptidase I